MGARQRGDLSPFLDAELTGTRATAESGETWKDEENSLSIPSEMR